MRGLATMLVVLVGAGACSSSIPRHSAVFIPAEPPTAPPATPTNSQPAGSNPVATGDTSGWVTLAPQGEGFSVLMPGKATSSTLAAKTPNGDAPTTIWEYSASTEAFGVARAKFPAGAMSSGAPADVLGAIMTPIATNILPGASITSQSDVTLDGHPGRSMAFADSKTTVQCEFFVVGDDVYAAFVAYPAGKMDAVVAQAFFASFQLTV